jgi:archaellum component FlaG (FlaF/FlaG flagellin family)
VYEGGYKKYENVTFNHAANTAVTNEGVYKVPNCVQDVLSAIYYARNIDFNKYNPGDKIPFSMFLDNETYDLYIRYIGKETIKTKYGKFKAIKYKPLLIKGTIFEGGEKMMVWVSDDANRIPVRVESPISVGNIKVDMMGYRNLKYPLTSLISVR